MNWLQINDFLERQRIVPEFLERQRIMLEIAEEAAKLLSATTKGFFLIATPNCPMTEPASEVIRAYMNDKDGTYSEKISENTNDSENEENQLSIPELSFGFNNDHIS